MQTALRHAGVSAAAVLSIAVHGTGTPLGDPIEIGAIQQTFRTAAGTGPLTLVSNKSCFGHTEGAAGAPELSPCLLPVIQISSLDV